MPNLAIELHNKLTQGAKLTIRVSSDALANWLVEALNDGTIDSDTLEELWEEAQSNHWDVEREVAVETASIVRDTAY